METRILISGGLEPEQGTGKKKLLILLLIVFVVIGSTGVAYAYVEFDLFKSAKQVYLETEANNLEAAGKALSELVETYKQNIFSYGDSPVHQRQEISASVDVPPALDPNSRALQEQLKRVSFKLDSYRDVPNGQSYLKFDLGVGGHSLIGAEMFQDTDRVGFAVPAVYPKYGYVYLKDREKVKRNFGAEIPKRTIGSDELLKTINVSRQQYEPILKQYGLLYAGLLKKEQVVTEKGFFEEGDARIPVKVITVTFSAAQYSELVNKVADKLANDDQLAQLLSEKYSDLRKLYEEAGYKDPASKLNKDQGEIKKAFQDLADDLKRSSNDNRNTARGIKMRLSVDSKHTILQREISSLEESPFRLRLAHWADAAGKLTRLFNIQAENDGKLVDFKMLYSQKREDKVDKQTLNVTMSEQTGSKQSFSLQAEVDSALKTGEQGKTRERQSSGTIKLHNSSSGADPVSITFQTRQLSETAPKVPLPQLVAGNSLDLGNSSQKELLKAQQEIQRGLQLFMLKNQFLLQPKSL